MMAVSTERKVGRQDLNKSPGMGSRAMGLMGALLMRSWTSLGVRTANSEKAELATSSENDSVELG